MNKLPIIFLPIMALTATGLTYGDSSDHNVNAISNIQFVMNNQSETPIRVNMVNAGLYGSSGGAPHCVWQDNDETSQSDFVKKDTHDINFSESGSTTCKAEETQGVGYYYTLTIKSLDSDGNLGHQCEYEFSSGSNPSHQVFGGFLKTESAGGQCPLFTTMSYDKTSHTTVFYANFIHSTGEKSSD